jgi:hypothetical protein
MLIVRHVDQTIMFRALTWPLEAQWLPTLEVCYCNTWNRSTKTYTKKYYYFEVTKIKKIIYAKRSTVQIRVYNVRAFRLSPQYKWDIRSCGRVTERLLVVTDVSGKTISPIFKGRAVQEEFFLLLDVTSHKSEDVKSMYCLGLGSAAL